MGAVGDLYQLARELLEACEAAVALAPGGPIPTSFVSPGSPPFDCPPMLTVHVGTVGQTDTIPTSPAQQPGFRVQTTGHVNVAAFVVTVLRCTPTLREVAGGFALPSPAKLEQSAEEIEGDLWAIWNHLATLKRQNLLFAGLCRAAYFDPAIPVPIQGGAAGWQLPVRVELDGYATTVAA